MKFLFLPMYCIDMHYKIEVFLLLDHLDMNSTLNLVNFKEKATYIILLFEIDDFIKI